MAVLRICLVVVIVCVGEVVMQVHTHVPPYSPGDPSIQAPVQPREQQVPPEQKYLPQSQHQPEPHEQQPLQQLLQLQLQQQQQQQSDPQPRGYQAESHAQPLSVGHGEQWAPVTLQQQQSTYGPGHQQSTYGPGQPLHEPRQRRVEDTLVQCLKTHMLVTFRFTAAFSGYIYPHQHFRECLLFQGQNSRNATLQLKHGTCGDQEKRVVQQGKSYLDPVIEHRLMIQWEPDIVCEDDSSVIVRCDRPDDYNKTVEWSLETRNLLATLERSTHPGPKMWMEIQVGEGPTAPPLSDQVVYIGDVLTLVFTLSDNVYWFDSNILTCYAVDGGEEVQQIEWASQPNKQITARSRVYSGETTVIEDGCSVKPKIFSHFLKEKHTRPNGDLVTLHYAHFKAFRFPTSLKIILQCNVQVCYKECVQPPPCSEAFHPRTSESQQRRRREASAAVAKEGAHEVDKVQLYRSIDVFLAEEGGEKKIHVNSPIVAQALKDFCYSPTVYYSTVIGLVAVIVILIVMICAICLRDRMPRASFYTPTKSLK
nr:uncharacterized protein LOC123745576 isoform X1 [Procambarus clarkii]